MGYKNRNCTDCGAEFTPWQYNQKRCGACVVKQGSKYQGAAPTKECPTCGKMFTRSAPRQTYCSKECGGTQRHGYIQASYGLTPKQHIELIKSCDNKCQICGNKPEDIPTLPSNHKHLCVDHDHSTGVVRGLLCHHCNTGLGQFKDNPEFLKNAVKYLIERAETIPSGSTPDKDSGGSAMHP
jgi:hypothetical protein